MSVAVHVELIPIFDDNYVFVLVDPLTKEAVVVDPGEDSAVDHFLQSQKLRLTKVLLTHHHADHIGGALALKNKWQALVFAPLKNKTQIPFADCYLIEGDRVEVHQSHFSVLELAGHTLGHIAYWDEKSKYLFSGDVLFGLGCGRLFEGSPEQMYAALQRIKALPSNSLVFCTHEYTETNLQFCKMLTQNNNSPLLGGSQELEIYENQLRSRRQLNLPSVPLKLSLEVQVNPFLLAKDITQFAHLRDLRDLRDLRNLRNKM